MGQDKSLEDGDKGRSVFGDIIQNKRRLWLIWETFKT
jgi:hypothetical protein